jgi:hypothetical protein
MSLISHDAHSLCVGCHGYSYVMQGSDSEGIPFAVKLSFYEVVNRAGFSSAYQEKVYWEVWKIQLRVLTGCSQNSTGALVMRTCIQPAYVTVNLFLRTSWRCWLTTHHDIDQ